MRTMVDRFRDRRTAARRARAINKALQHVSSQTVRDEILTIASRTL